jgi:hypothetical protein
MGLALAEGEGENGPWHSPHDATAVMVSFEPRNGSFEPANRSLAPRRFDQTPSKHDRSVSNFTPPDVYMNTCKDAPAAGSICLRSPRQPSGVVGEAIPIRDLHCLCNV